MPTSPLPPAPLPRTDARLPFDAVRADAERRQRQQIALLELLRDDLRAGEAATRRVLEVVAGTLRVERVSVWHLTPDRDAIRCGGLYEWSADRHSAGMVLSAADYPGYFAALATEEVIAAADARTDPRTREFRDGYLAPLGITSMLDVPLLVGGRVTGVLCHEQIGPPREWAADEQAFALAAANILSLAAEQGERRRAEDALRASEERFRGAMEGSLDAVFFLVAERDAAGRITDFRFADLNRRGAALISRDREGVLGRRLCELLPVNRSGGFFDKYVRVVETGEPLEEEFPIAAEGFTAGWLHHQVVKVADGVAITSQDVTARKQAEMDLRASEERFELAVRGSRDGIWDWDLRTGRVYFSPRWKEMLGYAEHEVAGHVDEWRRLVHPDDLPAAEAALHAYFSGAAPRYELELRMRHKDGTPRWIYTRGMAQFAADGTPVRMAGSHTDVTPLKRVEEDLRQNQQRLLESQRQLEEANARLRAMATTDRLTGVKNRGAFNDKLGEEFDRAVRYGHPLSVVLLDVDHFKQFNDAFGHPAGDAVLQRVAGLLQHTVRGSDFVARYGGEEFAILLPDTEYAGAMVLAERCRRAVAGASWDRRPVTVSVGVGTLTPATGDAAALVKEADDALYRSKQTGRNRVSHGSAALPFPPLRTPS